ncbi:MFS transporter [Photobacterium andalusiense]|uniref:Inner membrane transport protein YnfM n=1 Tax=Photobacterium andalusiense TaxID=2204296 RepID=A0A1Y6M8M0_9GAMM|nr:MFS transporter [Photobacterium andalusiense]SMY32885.1 Inner membrane transport protein YnfM [Photobacterium andalusiense]
MTLIAQPLTKQQTLPLKQLFGLSVGAGFSVSAIYYNQPIIGLLSNAFQIKVSEAGLIAMLTQIGYALGIFFLVPLGDMVNRKKLIISKLVLLCAALWLCSFSSTFPILLITSLCVGILATSAQDIVLASTVISPPNQRGKSVGIVMTGLFSGILLSRVFSGIIGQFWGWAIIFQLAASIIMALIIYFWFSLPTMPSQNTLTYKQIMASLKPLWQQFPQLRQSVVAQCFVSIAFSAFWTTLALFLSHNYGLGSATAGTFGLAGAAGAISAPLIGGLSDRIGAHKILLVSISIVILSFIAMLFIPFFAIHLQIGWLVLCVILFDFGINATLVSHQTIVYSLQPEARGRLNSILFTFMFIGMAIGSAAGSYLYQHVGWNGVLMLTIVAPMIALIIRMKPVTTTDLV